MRRKPFAICIAKAIGYLKTAPALKARLLIADNGSIDGSPGRIARRPRRRRCENDRRQGLRHGVSGAAIRAAPPNLVLIIWADADDSC